MRRLYVILLLLTTLPFVGWAQHASVDRLIEAHSEADGVMHQDVSGAMLWVMRKSDKSGKLDNVDRVNILMFKDIEKYASFSKFIADMELTFSALGIAKVGEKREKDTNMIIYAKESGTPDKLYMVIEPDKSGKAYLFMSMEGDIEAIIESQK